MISSLAAMATALVTGGAGFIGAAVVRALGAAGHRVSIAGMGWRTDPLTPERIAALAPELDLVVHCAGGSSVGASLQDPYADFAKSVEPFACLLHHLRSRAGVRVVLLSSAAVYGNAVEVPTPETAPVSPISPYGIHKQICEQLCMSYGRTFGVASVIVRLFSIYGPGLRKQLLWDACRKARAGDLVFAGSGDEHRDWLHVDDAASLILAATPQASPEAPIFNGGTGVGARVRDVVESICRELGVDAPRFSGTARPGDPSRYIADITRASALGWSPQFDLARGLSEYVAWFREQE
jgi:UDP-glucose 4-epimerase